MPKGTVSERVSVLETKMDNLDSKVDELKTTVKDNDTELKTELKKMYEASCSQHAQLSTELKDLKSFKDKLLIAGIILGPILTYLITHINWIELLQNAPK